MTQADQAVRFASGVSEEDDLGEALDEAIGEVAAALGPEPLELALVFASYHHRNRFNLIASEVQAQLRPRVALGVTAVGIIGSGFELENRPGLAILGARLGGAWVHAFTYQDLDWSGQSDPHLLRLRLLGPYSKSSDLAALVMFADPFSTPMLSLLPALNDAFAGVPVIGGMASGAATAGDNRLMLNSEISREGAVGGRYRYFGVIFDTKFGIGEDAVVALAGIGPDALFGIVGKGLAEAGNGGGVAGFQFVEDRLD